MFSAVIQIGGLIIWGLIIGAVARLLKPGKQNLSVFMTLLLGVVSAVIAGLLVGLIGYGNVFELNFWGFVVAVIVGVLLIGAAEGLSSRGRSRA